MFFLKNNIFAAARVNLFSSPGGGDDWLDGTKMVEISFWGEIKYSQDKDRTFILKSQGPLKN